MQLAVTFANCGGGDEIVRLDVAQLGRFVLELEHVRSDLHRLCAFFRLHGDRGGVNLVDRANEVDRIVALRHRRNGEERDETSKKKGFGSHGYGSLSSGGGAYFAPARL